MYNKISILILIGLVVYGACVCAKDLTPNEIAERRAALKAKRYSITGGIVAQSNGNERVIALLNCENAVDDNLLSEIANSIAGGIMLPVVISNTRPHNAGVVLEIRDSDYPATFVIAPENGYGMLNVGVLKRDRPDNAKLSRRITQEVWRTIIMALGGGYDREPRCLMKPFASLEELDACPSTCPCPLSFDAVISGAARFGVVPERKVSYKTACEEGWAPAPTNDVQKAIWEKVKAEKSVKPSNPIKVNFDPKTAPKVGE